jgi:hypothetical protein
MTQEKQTLLDQNTVDAFGKAMRPHLDASVSNVKPDIAFRLAEARRKAVASMELQAATAAQNVGGGTMALSGGWRDRISDWRFWGTGLLVTAVFATYGYSEWRDFVTAQDNADVDAMILGDDLPVDALLDKGFSHFVKEDN